MLTSVILWNGFSRIALFWLLVGAGLAGFSRVTPFSNWWLVLDVLKEVTRGDINRVSTQDFAFALSSGIVQFALTLALTFFIAHVLLLRVALSAAKRTLGRTGDAHDFAAQFDTISDRLRRNAVVAPAWREFEKTAVRKDDAVHTTVRPNVFINLSDAREQLFGLKMMPSIPGFFVGLGLLLTFIGLVLALSKAAGSTGAQSAGDMTNSLHELLAAATFKFSTSIAGLGASLGLSLLFRVYQIWIESSFYRFCQALETRMTFHPAQEIAAESRDILAAQRDELKEINSDRFFSRLGQSVSLNVEGAVSAAVRPMTERLDSAMGQLTKTSRSGLEELLNSFLNTLRGGAGIELVQVAKSLDAARGALESVQRNLAGSGADFAQRLTEASETMSKVVADAGRTLGGSASGVAGTVEVAMAGVMQKLDAQMTHFGSSLENLQARLTQQTEATARSSREAGQAAAEASRQVAQEALQTVRAGMDEVIKSMRDDIGRLSETLRQVTTAIAGQTQQIDAVSVRSRETADAFGRVANDVRSASAPLLTHSDRVASSTDRMAASIASSVSALSTTQQSADTIAAKLSAHLEQIGRVWDQYEQRFKSVDEDLGRAADRFHEEVSRHQEAMRNFVSDVDKHTEKILGTINSTVVSLGESVETLNETLDGFVQAMTRHEATK